MSAASRSQRFLYTFPERVETDGAGRASLQWPPGVEPFGATLQLQLNDAHGTIQTRASALSAEECERVIAIGDGCPRMDGRVEIGPDIIRASHIAWIEPAEGTHWLYHRLGMLFAEVNRHFGFELTGFVDALQYTVYGPEQHFDWHVDMGPEQTSARKLSMSIQLVAGGAYTGGALDFIGMEGPAPSRELGTATVFPSYLAHRVAPIVSGVRRSLVAWAYGPSFR